MSYTLNLATIAPAMVATHMALGTGRDVALLKTAWENAEK